MRIVSFASTLATPFRLRVVQCSAAPIGKDIVVSDFCAELGTERGIRALDPR